MTDMGPSFYGAPAQDGTMAMPFLSTADNIVYELDGGVHKMPGTAALNVTPLVDTTTQVTGIYDFWKQGTGAAPSQKRLAVEVEIRPSGSTHPATQLPGGRGDLQV